MKIPTMLPMLTLLATLAIAQPTLQAQSQPKLQVMPAADWSAIQAELEDMQKTDQSLRNEFTVMLAEARAKGVEVDKEAQEAIWKKIREQDRENQKRMSIILDTYGWPARSKVGSTAATTVFLVVQHADLDYHLKYIDRMREAVDVGEAAKQQLALLEDRVLVFQGKPQRYGSQVETRDGVGLHPVEDPGNLDTRRATMELGPMCEHLKKFVKQFGPIVYPPCVKSSTVAPLPGTTR